MHELLVATSPSRARALEQCNEFLARRWKRWRIARAFLPHERRDDLVALLAWHALVRQIAETERGFERRRGLEELASVLQAARDGTPSAPIGIALLQTLRRHGLASELFLEPLAERKREEHVSTFETRAALTAHARAVAAAEGRALLHVLDRATPRNEALADALAVGLQLARWIVGLHGDLERGRLRLAVDDLARHEVEITALIARQPSAGLCRVIAESIVWTRGWLAKGWPLCRELGGWRGRHLAFILRWHAASLSAVEAARFDVLRGAPPAGWPRMLACASSSLALLGPPRFR